MNRFAQNIKSKIFKKEKPGCGSCYYFGFKKLLWWCYHPDRNCQIEDFEEGCEEFSDAMIVDNSRKERVDR